jgi:hypothetical protein
MCAPSTKRYGSPATWPRHAQGVGFLEAPRGALAHWIVIDDGKISNYQAVVPTTWNAGPARRRGYSKAPMKRRSRVRACRPEAAARDPAHDPQLRSLPRLRGARDRSGRRGVDSGSRPIVLSRMFGTSHAEADLLLLHAPSVYDFRERAILYGPVSDMVPSSTVFEMYPLGFLTIASYLHDRGMRVRIVNLALRMMNSRRFDVPRFLAKQKTQGDRHRSALAAARARRLGGRAHREGAAPRRAGHHGRVVIDLLSPRADRLPASRLSCCAATAPSRRCISCCSRSRRRQAGRQDPNLTWKDAAGIHVNPLAFVPDERWTTSICGRI